MLYVTLPDEKTRKASFYLAMEEYVARNAARGDYLFHWQVSPSVVIGRNQLAANEVNIGYCKTHGINVFRRKSGGGCVYADEGNVMFSFVTDADNVSLTFNRYIMMMVLMLRKMGVPASATGRNDIQVDGCKVSGNAFYHLPGRSIVHGTMLYDTNMNHMSNAITPPGDKLETRGVESVRQRITLLKDYVGMGIDAFKTMIRRGLCNGEYRLTEYDVGEIEALESRVYLSPSFVYGKDPSCSIVRRCRLDGVGGIEARIELKGCVIRNVSLAGDFFAYRNVGHLLCRLKGVALDRESLFSALPERLDDVIMNLRKDDFVSILSGDFDK